jgi:hypothetical protein
MIAWNRKREFLGRSGNIRQGSHPSSNQAAKPSGLWETPAVPELTATINGT